MTLSYLVTGVFPLPLPGFLGLTGGMLSPDSSTNYIYSMLSPLFFLNVDDIPVISLRLIRLMSSSWLSRGTFVRLNSSPIGFFPAAALLESLSYGLSVPLIDEL
jgi:hypothetical protein